MDSPSVSASAQSGLTDGLGFRIGRLARTLRASWSGELTALGLTPPLAAVLRAVSDRPGISVRALSRTLGCDAMSAKRCADELESLGLIRSGRLEEDRRPRTLTTTPRGRTMVKRVAALVSVRETVFAEVLGETGRSNLAALIEQMEKALAIDHQRIEERAGNDDSRRCERDSRSAGKVLKGKLSGE
ncbi:MAG: winged helix-turn-helix transcriptional regulator [Acidimicrobiaceae bacterium]|nr:winged helix-turn-helix transcriptional regulator [Acidimicrobiaceae bacterium]